MDSLNVVHGGQALATALKGNKSVVDINLARYLAWNRKQCGDDLAEVWWTWVHGSRCCGGSRL